MFILLTLAGLLAALDVLNCFFPNNTVDIFLNNQSMVITVWPLPLNQQTVECTSLQSATGMKATVTIGSYKFSQTDVSSWSMERSNSLTFTCSTDKTTGAECQKNLTGSTVAQLELTCGSTTVSLVTTNVYYVLANNSACWTDPKVAVDYIGKEICFLATPSDCDLPNTDPLRNSYEALILMHLNTMPDVYLNVTLSSHGTSATLPNFSRPYNHNLVTRFCYACKGVLYPGNDWLTTSDTYDSCIELIDILKTETAWSATLIVYVPIPGSTKTTQSAAILSLEPQTEVVTPDTVAEAGITSAVKVSTDYSKCYSSVTIQVYFGILLVLLERDTAAICNDIMDYREIVLCGEIADAQTSSSASSVRISLQDSDFTFKQTKQFFPCTNVTCLRDINMLLLSNVSLVGSFNLQYFSTRTVPETIIPFPGSVQRTCFYRGTLVVTSDAIKLQPAEQSSLHCPIAEGKMDAVLSIYIHSGSSISAITLERLFLQMSGEIEYKQGQSIVFSCNPMYQTGIYLSENVPKADIEYYVSGSCPSKLKSVLEAYSNGTGVYAETSFTTKSSTSAANTHKEYQYIFIKENYSESALICVGIVVTVLIGGIMALVITYNKGHIMEP